MKLEDYEISIMKGWRWAPHDWVISWKTPDKDELIVAARDDYDLLEKIADILTEWAEEDEE